LLRPAGDPFGTPVPVAGLKQGVLPYARSFWSTPNGSVLGGGLATSFANPTQKVREDFGLTRLDYNMSAKDSFSANYLIQDGENDVPSPNPNLFRPLPLRTKLLSLQKTHVFSPALIKHASVGL